MQSMISFLLLITWPPTFDITYAHRKKKQSYLLYVWRTGTLGLERVRLAGDDLIARENYTMPETSHL